MERLLIVGIETEIGRHLIRNYSGETEILGAALSAQPSRPVCGIRRLSRTTADSARLLLETERITGVVYCGQASSTGWSTTLNEVLPCSDTAVLQAWSTAAGETGVHFSFVSSDCQFDGPWVFHEEESSSIAESPLAQSIRRQEDFVSERDGALIVRSHVCGFSPQSLLTQRLLLERPIPPARRLWYATPIYARRFAQLLSGLIDRRASGIYHLGGGERISCSQFLTQLDERFHAGNQSMAGTSYSSSGECPAPRETSLRSSKARRLLHAGLPTISDFLDDVSEDLTSGAAHELAEHTTPAPSKVA